MDCKILSMRNYYWQDGHNFWVEKMFLIIETIVVTFK